MMENPVGVDLYLGTGGLSQEEMDRRVLDLSASWVEAGSIW